MEYMSRSLRMAEKARDSSCITAGKNYELTRSEKGIKFINSNNGQCWEFFVEDGQLKINKSGTAYNLTSDDLEVKAFKISISGDDNTSNEQPKVTFYLDVQAKKGVLFRTPSIKIQTTISQRNLNL